MARRQSFSDWLNNIRHSPGERSVYWSEHEPGKGFYNASVQDGKVHNWGGAGFNRARGTDDRYLDALFKKADFDKPGYHFKCTGAKFVDECWYDPDNKYLKVQFVESRTGKSRYPGIPLGNITIYDHVPENVFQYLKSLASSVGHVGREFWDMLRVRGSQNQSKYPYTDREG